MINPYSHYQLNNAKPLNALIQICDRPRKRVQQSTLDIQGKIQLTLLITSGIYFYIYVADIG